MPSLQQLVALSRLHIALVGASGSMTFSYILTGSVQWGLVLYVLLDWFLVNLFNKVTDAKEDATNKISHAAFAGKNAKAIYSFLTAVFLASFASHFYYLPALALPRIFCHALGFLYNFKVLPFIPRLKSVYFVKNLASAVGFLMTLFVYPLSTCILSPDVQGSVDALKVLVAGGGGGAAAAAAADPSASPYGPYFLPALMLFFAVFEISFEVIYDIRDYVGDKQEGIKTYAVVHGKAWACRLVLMLDIAALLIMLVALIGEIVWWKQGVLLLGPLVHAIGFYVYTKGQVTMEDDVGVSTAGDTNQNGLPEQQHQKKQNKGAGASLSGEVSVSESAVQCLTWGFVVLQLGYIGFCYAGLPTEASFIFGTITPIKVIVWAMCIICFFTYQWSRKFFGFKNFVIIYVIIAFCGGLCENTAILWYDYYHYNMEIWNVYVGLMPLEVTLIWPQVIFCSYRFWRDNVKLKGLPLAIAGGIEVFQLAIFVEVCCVSRGFWKWTESNIAGVPIIGCLGWGLFGFTAHYALECMSRGQSWKAYLLPITSMVAVHVGLLFLWNVCGFKHFSNYDIPLESAGPVSAVLMIAQTAFQFKSGFVRHANLTVIDEGPRMLAAVALGYTMYMGSPPRDLLLVFGSAGLPYFAMLSLGWPEYLLKQREMDLATMAADAAKKVAAKRK